MRENIERSARHLYGLVHARYITTTRGLAKMVWKKPYGHCCPSANVDSLKNTRKETSVNALESCANHILCFPLGWQIILMSSP